MPSHAAAGSLAGSFSPLHLAPPPERPSTPPTPEMPLCPSSASSFILLTPPSPTFTGPILDSPTHHPAAPPSSPTEPERRGRSRQRSPSLPSSPSLAFGRLRLTSPDDSSRSRSPQPDPSPTRSRSRSPPANRQQPRIPSDFEFSFSFSLDEEISASDYWANLEVEHFRWEMKEIVNASGCPPDCNCNPDLWEDAVAEHFDWDSFDESFENWRRINRRGSWNTGNAPAEEAEID